MSTDPSISAAAAGTTGANAPPGLWKLLALATAEPPSHAFLFKLLGTVMSMDACDGLAADKHDNDAGQKEASMSTRLT